MVTALKYDQYNNNVTITATSVKDPTIKASITVNIVLPPVTEVKLNKTETSLYVGGTETLVATILPEGAYQGVTWTSADKKIATVDANGKVTGVAIGDVEIKAASSANSSKYATCMVHVIKTPIESVAFDPNSKELAVGATYQLTPVVTPAAAASQYTASYESNKTSVATVSETGLVRIKSQIPVCRSSESKRIVRAGHSSINSHGLSWNSPSTWAYPESMIFH